MKQTDNSEIARITRLLENVLQEIGQPPLDENEYITVDRSGLPKEIKITFYKEGAVKLDMIITEKKDTFFRFNNGMWEHREKNTGIIDSIFWIERSFEQMIGTYLLHSLQFVVSATTKTFRLLNKKGEVIDERICKNKNQVNSAEECTFTPFFDLPEQGVEVFFENVGLRYAARNVERKEIEKMKKKERIHVNNKVAYYKILWFWIPFLLVIPVCNELGWDYPFYILGGIVIAFSTYCIYRYNLLLFNKYKISCTEEQFRKVCLDTLDLDWSIRGYMPEYCEFITDNNERIYIIRDEKSILIQSIPDPDMYFRGVIPSKRNRENIVRFMNQLQKEVQNK